MSKRSLDSFFSPVLKKPRIEQNPELQTSNDEVTKSTASSEHETYPWPISELPQSIREHIELLVTAQGSRINDQPNLDLLYFQPFIPKVIEKELFKFFREHLFFYRVTYNITKFGKETRINTPRFTTVFGVDETSRFINGGLKMASDISKPIGSDKYRCKPRPIPECLDFLRRVTEAATNTKYNFCLVNYYATGSDSISFHSDDERFLGTNPAIASFSLGAKRDFLMKHKPPKEGAGDLQEQTKPLKFPLSSGDMILMQGPTQANWLHSIPKRKAGDADEGRINITLRRAMVPGGTENYYRYNVADGEVYKWNNARREMLPWKPL
ncbi:MAG: hypothetical protein Q9227_004175 [Pyrenula ochraceoflavens]